jgi:tetratricopeptide (TPR) repeat protein
LARRHRQYAQFSRIAVGLAFAALTLTCPRPAAAEGEENWHACIAAPSTPDQRVAACSAVIDGKTETGKRLAGAYCNRGHGLTEQHHFDAALADLNEAIRIDPSYACAYNNRGRVYAFMRDFDRAISN